MVANTILWFGKPYKELTPDELLEYQVKKLKFNNPNYVPHKGSIIKQLFGPNMRYKDLTEDQVRQYNKHVKMQAKLKGARHNSLTTKLFGKCLNECTDEEVSEYYRYIESIKHDKEIVPRNESRVMKDFGKRSADLTPQEMSSYIHNILHRDNDIKPHNESYVRRIYGKKMKELTTQELTEYRKYMASRNDQS